jgi:hypothetical protein
MIGTKIALTFRDGRPPEEVAVTHYAIGRIARWARANGMPGLSPDSAESLPEQVLCIQLSCWAEATRGHAKPVDFDEWVAGVEDFNPVAGEPLDPTQPAT